jgi:hypothetical protein
LLPENRAEPPTTASIELLGALLQQLREAFAEFRKQDIQRQAVQANLVERMRVFGEMGAALEHLRGAPEVKSPTTGKQTRNKPPAGS